MYFSPTLTAYLARQFALGIAYTFLLIAAVVLLADLVELLRRAAGRDSANFTTVLMMAFLKLPAMMQKLMPFAVLFGGIWTISRLTRSHELMVARAAGVSAWQFLAPAFAIALAIGVVTVTAYNPFAAAMMSRYQQMEARHLKGKANLLSVSAAGLWMRQADGAGQSVIHAERLSTDSVTFSKVIIFLFREGDQFDGRIDAEEARLTPGNWQLKNVLVTRPGRLAERHEQYTLPTSLTMAQILDSFAPPETLSFWSLSQFIDSLEAAGFSAVRHRLYWHNMLATPFLLCAMILLAATFSLRHSRFGGTGVLLGFGVLAGFIFYFLSDVVSAFALAGSLPVTLAAWAPSAICALVGLAIMFQMEDG